MNDETIRTVCKLSNKSLCAFCKYGHEVKGTFFVMKKPVFKCNNSDSDIAWSDLNSIDYIVKCEEFKYQDEI